MRHPGLILLCACFPWGAFAAQVQPVWSVPLGGTQLNATSQGIEDAYVLADGSAYFRSYGSGARARIRLMPDGQVERRQEYDNLSTTLVDDNGQHVLLSQSDGVSEVSLLVREHTGRTVWIRSIPVESARFFANGDVLVQSPEQVIRLRGSDGALLWRRELLDLHPYAESSSFRLAEQIEEQIDLAGRLYVKTPPATSSQRMGWQVALDPADGSVRWSRRFGPEAPPDDDLRCGNVTGRGVVVWVCQDQTFGANGWVYHTRVQLYRHSDGRHWSTTLPDRTLNLMAGVEIGPDQVYFGLVSAENLILGILDIEDGTPLWEKTETGGYELQLAATPDGDLLHGVRRSDGNGGSLTIIKRHRSSDGGLVWAIQPQLAAGSMASWRQLASTVSVATIVGISDDARARLQTFSLATGELLTTAEDVVRRFNWVPTARTVAGSNYCHATIASPAAVTLRCLSGTSGMPLWTLDLPPPAPADAINAIWLAPLSSGRLVLTTQFTRLQGGTPVELYAATILDVATGATAWQRIDSPVRPLFLGTANGDALRLYGSCPTPPGCSGYVNYLERISGTDGVGVWSRPVPGFTLAEGDDLAVLYRSDITAPGLSVLDSRTGADTWSAALPPGVLGVGALVSPAGHVVTENSRNLGGGTRQIEIRGFDRALGTPRWLVTPSIPSSFTSDSVLWPLEGEDQLVIGILQLAAGPTVPWLASIDAATGGVHWERALGIGADASRRALLLGGTPANGLWLAQSRVSPSDLQRKSLARLDPSDGSLGREFQYASSRDLLPGDPSDLPTPTGLLDDNSVLAQAWREVDGLSLPILQRWPAPSGPEVDVALELASPSPAMGQGPSAVVDLRIENRSPVPVTGARLAFVATSTGKSARVVSCSAAVGAVVCTGGEDDRVDLQVDLGPNTVALVRYDVSGTYYRPAESVDNGLVYFHLNLPYEVADDYGDNSVSTSIWLGGTSNGFE